MIDPCTVIIAGLIILLIALIAVAVAILHRRISALEAIVADEHRERIDA